MVDLPPQWHRGRAGISSPNGIMAKWETRLWGAHTHCCSDVGNDRVGLGRSGGTLVGGGRGDPHARLSPGHRKALGYLAMYPHLPLANAEMSPCSVRPQRPSFNIHAAAWAHLGLRWRFGSAGSRAVPSLQSWEGMVDGGLSKSTSCVGETESGERGRAERKKLRSPSRVVVHVVHLSGEFRARVQRGQRGRGAARQGVRGQPEGLGMFFCSGAPVGEKQSRAGGQERSFPKSSPRNWDPGWVNTSLGLPLTVPWGTWRRRTSSSAPPSPTWPPRSCANHPPPRGAPARGMGQRGHGLGSEHWQPHNSPPHCTEPCTRPATALLQMPSPSELCPGCVDVGLAKGMASCSMELWVHEAVTPKLRENPRKSH